MAAQLKGRGGGLLVGPNAQVFAKINFDDTPKYMIRVNIMIMVAIMLILVVVVMIILKTKKMMMNVLKISFSPLCLSPEGGQAGQAYCLDVPFRKEDLSALFPHKI